MGTKEEITEKIKNIYPNLATNIIRAISKEKPTTFRLNTDLEIDSGETLKGFTRVKAEIEGIGVKEGPIQGSYIVIEGGEKITETDAYKSGKIYLQELSSQIPAQILDPQPGDAILDLCAAPGSKTTQIAEIMKRIERTERDKGKQGEPREETEIVAVEKNKPRFFRLIHNVEMQKADGVKPILGDGITLYKRYPQYLEYFDKVLVDAPCSNEGSINLSNSRSYKFWNHYKYKEMSRIQKGLIIAGYRMLKTGGSLVYSTCTYSVEENEGVVDWLLSKIPSIKLEKIEIPIKNVVPGKTSWQGKQFNKELAKSLRIIPDEKFTCFYIAKLNKV